jgi:Fe2+ or Zn2+ uptake regulation protein
MADHDWVLCRNEGTIEDATMQVVAEIHKALHQSENFKPSMPSVCTAHVKN